jgi:hypothetical protein
MCTGTEWYLRFLFDEITIVVNQDMCKHFVFKRNGTWQTPSGVTSFGKNVIRVPAETLESIPMTVEEARQLIKNLSPGMLYLLHEAGGSARFSRALQLAGYIG